VVVLPWTPLLLFGHPLTLPLPDENRQLLVNAGATPVLVELLSSPDVDVQYYCTTALSNIAVDANNRRRLAQTEPKLVQSLVNLMDSSSPKVQCQAALSLRNLASDEQYQLDIVRAGGLQPLLRLLQSSYLPLILSSVACVRNVSIHPSNESPIIEANFLKPLVDLLGATDNEEIHCHAISTLRNLAASSDRNKELVLGAGAVQKCKQLVFDVSVAVQSEMTAAIAVLALSDELKPHLLALGVAEVLIPLTNSASVEVQGNSAAALGNLTSKGGSYNPRLMGLCWATPLTLAQSATTRSLSSCGPSPAAACTRTSTGSCRAATRRFSTFRSGRFCSSSRARTRRSSGSLASRATFSSRSAPQRSGRWTRRSTRTTTRARP
jgi:hypothetical protein